MTVSSERILNSNYLVSSSSRFYSLILVKKRRRGFMFSHTANMKLKEFRKFPGMIMLLYVFSAEISMSQQTQSNDSNST